jgi:hypothetical protein
MSSVRRLHVIPKRKSSTGSNDDLHIEPTISRTKIRSLEHLVTELQRGLESLITSD